MSCRWKGRAAIGSAGMRNTLTSAHESCSKHHAVLQFRQPDEPALYVLDLSSTHGTFLNGVRLEAMRFYRLSSRDRIRFAASTREYLVLHEGDEKGIE